MLPLIVNLQPGALGLWAEELVRKITNILLLDMKARTLEVGSLCGRGVKVCEEKEEEGRCMRLTRSKVEEQRYSVSGGFGQRNKLWWSGNSSGIGEVGILVKEELCEKVVDVRRKSDRVMVVVHAFGKHVTRVISAYGSQAERPLEEKQSLYDEFAGEYELQNSREVVFGLRDCNGHVGEEIEGFESVHGGNGIGKKNAEGRMLLEFCEHGKLIAFSFCGKLFSICLIF